MLPPGVGDDYANHVAKAIAEIVIEATRHDCTVIPWESMPALKQQVCESCAVPLFCAVSPLQYMREQLAQQRIERRAAAHAQPDASPRLA